MVKALYADEEKLFIIINIINIGVNVNQVIQVDCFLVELDAKLVKKLLVVLE